MDKRFLLTIARQGRGKSTLTKTLNERLPSAISHRFSDPIRADARTCGLLHDGLSADEERVVLQTLAQDRRREFGADYWEKALIELCLHDDAADIILDGAREPGDIGNLIKEEAFHAIVIDAPPLVAFDRLTQRAMADGKVPPTWEQFLVADAHINEVRVSETIALIQRERPDRLHLIDNSGSLEDSERAIDVVLARIGGR